MASDADNAELIPGYRIVSLIGRGGMGAVYRAVKQSINKEVALKVLLPSVSEDPVTSARFDREVRALARMRHPGLVNVVDAGVHGPYRYLVMDLVDGTDLETLVQDCVRETGRGLAADEVLDIADQILAALEYIDAEGMVHRDLKPANLLLDRDGRVLLCDLGLVRIADEDSKLTQRLMLGTPEYVSPEQVRGASDLDIRSDLYSLGATLFYLSTGRPLFAAETPMATAQAHLHEKAPTLSTLSPSTPPRLRGLVERLLHKQRERRFQTPREARVWLREFDHVRQRHRQVLAAVAVIVPLLLGWMAFGPHGRPPAAERAPVAVEQAIEGELMWIEASMRDCRNLLGQLAPGDPERREIERDLAAIRKRYSLLERRMKRR